MTTAIRSLELILQSLDAVITSLKVVHKFIYNLGCNTDNCNAPPGVNVTAIPARNEAPIVCYQGLHINGNNYSNYGYQVCHGECVSIMLSGTINSSTTYATLYACDPASACAAMGLRNNCSTIDGTVTACCCDSDACIDPIVGRQPGIPLQCYVGLVVPGMNISTGADMTCGGMCARVSTTINGNPAMSFHCVPTPICQSLGLYNSGGALYLDRSIEGYCCNNAPFCNTAGTNINTTGLQPVGAERPKACYSGMCSFHSGKIKADPQVSTSTDLLLLMEAGLLVKETALPSI